MTAPRVAKFAETRDVTRPPDHTVQGIAFRDIGEMDYYPAISLYMGARVRVNFGPDFAAPPQLPTDASDEYGMVPAVQPVQSIATRTLAEHVIADLLTGVEVRIERLSAQPTADTTAGVALIDAEPASEAAVEVC